MRKDAIFMKILPVTDASFAPYGRVVEGYDVAPLLAALEKTPLTNSVVYVLSLIHI